jgi:solute carrier family 31 (copper transporter), member 1
MFAASCIGVALLTVTLEFIRRLGKEYDAFLLRQFRRRAEQLHPYQPKADCNVSDDDARTMMFRASALQQLVRAIIHAVTFGLAYIIMLLSMYYNGYIIISIIIGAGLGKFLCDWMSHTITLAQGNARRPLQGGNTGGGVEEPSVCCG